jgi:uncharacterized protein YjbI with pentapeptide repeats
MANPEQLELLRQGAEVWNAWRANERSVLDLQAANLIGANLRGVDLSRAILHGTYLNKADLSEANLSGAILSGANLRLTNLRGTNLRGADISGVDISRADLSEANLSEATLSGSNFRGANLSDANLRGANLQGAVLSEANLHRANLSDTYLRNANLSNANLSGATLTGANLSRAILIETNLVDAILTDCSIYGISAWGVKLGAGTIQRGLIITPEAEPAITVDDLEVAQFVYLLLHNEKIRRVIDTVGKKGVLLLGRFTEDRIRVLERLRDELRKRDYVPIVFNFDKPETKDFTETVRLLAGMSKFVIADITNPKSSPLELQATVPEIMVPFQPIIERGEKPFSMLQDLWIKHRDWVFEPIEYSSVDRLVETMDAEIIRPAEARFDELVMRRAEMLKVRRV